MICLQKFSRNSTLKMHLNTHVNTKPYLCPIKSCKKRFIDKAQIKYHMKSHYKDASKDEFENLFNNYLNLTKDKIEMLISSREKEMKVKTSNKETILPKLPKFIRTKNSYDIIRTDIEKEETQSNEMNKIHMQSSETVRESESKDVTSNTHLNKKRILKIEKSEKREKEKDKNCDNQQKRDNNPDSYQENIKKKSLLEKFITAKLINSLK